MGLKHTLGAILCMLALTLAASVDAATTQGRISARVVSETISVLARTPLIFGYLMPGSSAGTVTLTPRNVRKTSGRVHLLPGLHYPATFVVKGAPNRAYSMHVPASMTFHGTSLLNLFGRGQKSQLTVKDFTTRSQNVGKDSSSGKLNRIGLDSITLGGTLVVPANVAPGLYSGLVPLTVSY